MPEYEIEMSASFPNQENAEEFSEEYEAITGNQADREGNTVTCYLYRHGDEISMHAKAEELGGTVEVSVLKDTE